jgi:hypothetical protein
MQQRGAVSAAFGNIAAFHPDKYREVGYPAYGGKDAGADDEYLHADQCVSIRVLPAIRNGQSCTRLAKNICNVFGRRFPARMNSFRRGFPYCPQ